MNLTCKVIDRASGLGGQSGKQITPASQYVSFMRLHEVRRIVVDLLFWGDSPLASDTGQIEFRL